MIDKYDEIAKELLPCPWWTTHTMSPARGCMRPGDKGACTTCICRDAVADALREQGAENERLKTQLESTCGFLCDLCKCREPVVSDEYGDWFHPNVGKEGKDCEASVIRRGWAMGDRL